MRVRIAQTVDEIKSCYPVMLQLREDLTEATFVDRVKRQRDKREYILAYVEDEARAVAVAGFWVSECLATGKYLYVDDLVTDSDSRSGGYGKILLDWIEDFASKQGCAQLRLDSAVFRAGAHKFYFANRMNIAAFHFSKVLAGNF